MFLLKLVSFLVSSENSPQKSPYFCTVHFLEPSTDRQTVARASVTRLLAAMLSGHVYEYISPKEFTGASQQEQPDGGNGGMGMGTEPLND